MTGCPAVSVDQARGIADALRAVDCLSAQATGTAFARLFGAGGVLGTALTILLTLYVAILALNLLTGRSRLGLSMLTPRAITLGLALTFATSWVAYQSVVWTLAMGGPDQIAGAIVGAHGSATSLFADRLDRLFAAVAEAAAAAQAAQGSATPKAMGFTPADMLWLGAFLLLLGSVGILLVTRIALAALLAVGPVFIVLALFRGTRGLFEGWLKGVALFALVPLFAVLIGGGAIAIVSPMVAGLSGGEIDMRTAVGVLLASITYCALMAIVLKVAVTLTAGWRLPLTHDRGGSGMQSVSASLDRGSVPPIIDRASASIGHEPGDERVRAVVAGASASTETSRAISAVSSSSDRLRGVIALPEPAPAIRAPTHTKDVRISGIGSQFRPAARARSQLPC